MNEDLFFHGATSETIESICKGSFDSREFRSTKLGRHTHIRTHMRTDELIAAQESFACIQSMIIVRLKT